MNVVIEPDDQVTTDKTSVTLDALNWNTLDAPTVHQQPGLRPRATTTCSRPGQVCVTGVPARSSAMTPPAMRFAAITWDSSDTLLSAVIQPMARPYDVHANGADHDSDSTTLDILIKDDDQVGVQFSPARLGCSGRKLCASAFAC
ncbi:MAG: hypothetical protein R2851_16770 [Caldilineaceae bacterium]